MNKRSGEEKDDKIVEIYKFVVLSYMVFLAAYGEGCHFMGYLVVVAGIFIVGMFGAT